MLKIVENHLFTVERVWFTNNISELSKKKCDITRFLRIPEQSCTTMDSRKLEKVCTLTSDLTEPVEVLLNRMKKSVKYEINRSEKEQEITCEYFTAIHLFSNKLILEDFKLAYYDFCIKAGNSKLKKAYHHKRVLAYIDNECILISKASFCNGNVWHMYVWYQSNAVLVYSFSDYRNQEVNKELAGRANKYLHYKDMLYLKDHKCTIYDWGNVTKFENYNGIDKFKSSFGGEQKIVYNYYQGNTMLGKILVKVKQLI